MPMRSSETETPRGRRRCTFPLLFSFLCPVIAAVLAYHLDPFDPVHLPLHELPPRPVVAPWGSGRGAELIGRGILSGPEDIAFDERSGLVYTGCEDGWIKTVRVNDSAVESWVNTGGRPLGLAIARHSQLIIADAEKGLLRVSQNGKVELLTDEAEGLKFKLTDGADVAKDGTIYFTDASYKYGLSDFVFDMLEGKPHGRLLSYDPSTGETRVLLRHLYFPNGVAVSPDQHFVVFCETVMRRCRKYYIRGQQKGRVGKFVERLSGLPDNIRYDGEGHFWVAIGAESLAFHILFKYPFLRKCLAMIVRYVGVRMLQKQNTGFIMAVDLEGKPSVQYFHRKMLSVTTGIKIRNHLYCGFLSEPFILRLDLDQQPAVHTV